MRTREILHLRTVTPALIGSAESGRAEWNGKAIRGQLRWWFRAVAGGAMHGNAARVRAVEREVFGGVDDGGPGDNANNSALRVMVHAAGALLADAKGYPPGRALDERELADLWGNSSEEVQRRLRLDVGSSNPIGYLGYGPIEYDKNARGVVWKRGCIAPDHPLTLVLQWNSQVSVVARNLFDRALWCWVNLGGIGARSRRGFGSLVAVDSDVGGDENAFRLGLAKSVGAASESFASGTLAEWSHFTAESHVYRSKAVYGDWSEAMKVAGAWLIAFRRRYGRADDERTKVQNRDYQWLKSPPPPAGVPDRAGFGLPLLFGRTATAAWGKKEGRRASPLLLHIGLFGARKYSVIFTYMPARLVPDGEKIEFRGTSSPATAGQQGIVRDFLDDLTKKKLIEVVL